MGLSQSRGRSYLRCSSSEWPDVALRCPRAAWASGPADRCDARTRVFISRQKDPQSRWDATLVYKHTYIAFALLPEAIRPLLRGRLSLSLPSSGRNQAGGTSLDAAPLPRRRFPASVVITRRSSETQTNRTAGTKGAQRQGRRSPL